MSNKILTWASIIVAATVLIGAGWAAWEYKADAHVVEELKSCKADAAVVEELVAAYKFDKLTQRHNAVQERLWALETLCRNNPSQCSTQVRAEIQHLRLELEELKREMSKRGS